MTWDRKPTRLPRAIRICRIGRAPAIRAPIAISPEGPAANENAAISTAIAAGKQTSGGDGALDGAPREQSAEGDDGLGAQAVVVRQPEGQEHEPARPDGNLVAAHRNTESRDHLAADDHPAQNAGDQRGQAHPHACGADLREQRQHVVVPTERRFGDAEPTESNWPCTRSAPRLWPCRADNRRRKCWRRTHARAPACRSPGRRCR